MILPVQISIFILLVLSMGLHEAAHARVGTYFGDPTPEEQGVNTWNPIPVILKNWISCLLIPGVTWFFMSFFFGFAMVGLNPAYMRPRRLGYFCAVAAGPAMNLMLSILFGGLFLVTVVYTNSADTQIGLVFWFVSVFNLLLFYFNLIPIPPFDGSSMLTTAIPALTPMMNAISGFGHWIFIGILWMSPAANAVVLWPAMQWGGLLYQVGKSIVK